ncbi:unnamed protein product [Rotaria sordida]|uniref:PIH1D1/2/3 CS-like domain-containing protein n=1 Tax=Rotaria sordida TaxID=392033 RepID=A0A819EMV6_9BILA|nr:unnamed protein product [Rotaria sordida]CAF1226408.1 unnamed protein product [Rotaria sordida]CAF1269439.1 unnamed protein product [Rotaria sordida]CAF1270098.1 unnamed protein product [Rotaria sordida]CAF1329006.1 unnamed protein product [Rotaria sordida]
MGQLTEQYIRIRAKPFIVEVDQQTNNIEQKTPINTSSIIEKGSIPEFKIIREPLEGDPNFLIMDIQLPKVKSAKTLTLDIGIDRIVLSTRSNVYYLDIWLPIDIDSDECGAQFDKATHILTITMPVKHDTT